MIEKVDLSMSTSPQQAGHVAELSDLVRRLGEKINEVVQAHNVMSRPFNPKLASDVRDLQLSMSIHKTEMVEALKQLEDRLLEVVKEGGDEEVGKEQAPVAPAEGA